MRAVFKLSGRMRLVLAALLFCGICPNAITLADDAAKIDLAALQGEWRMLAPDGSGKIMPDSKRVCEHDVTTVTIGGQLLMKSRFKLDPSKTPKAIDYEVLEGSNKGKSQLGIYEITGDTVKFCFAAPGKDRPTDFTMKPGEGQLSSAWKKVEK